MKDSINVKWAGGMAFEAEINEHKVLLDASPEVGGNNAGPRPKPLLMVSLAGCTGMDVISILRKMKVDVSNFNVKVEGTLTDEHPKYFISLHMIYEFWGKNLPEDKIKRAIELSQEKYCGVSATLKKSVELSYEVKLTEI